MDIVVIAGLVVVCLGILDGKALVPWESEVLVVLRSVRVVLEVIFDVALAADQ